MHGRLVAIGSCRIRVTSDCAERAAGEATLILGPHLTPAGPRASGDDINDMPFTTLLSAQIAEW